MPRKTSRAKAKKAPQVRHVHYIFVVLSVVVLALLVTVVVLPVRNSGVLSAHVTAHGPIDHGQNDNPLVHTTHEINHEGDQGEGSGGPFHTLVNKFTGKLNTKPDHGASDSAETAGGRKTSQ